LCEGFKNHKESITLGGKPSSDEETILEKSPSFNLTKQRNNKSKEVYVYFFAILENTDFQRRKILD
jgi:hypothetical protein